MSMDWFIYKENLQENTICHGKITIYTEPRPFKYRYNMDITQYFFSNFNPVFEFYDILCIYLVTLFFS